MPKRHRVRARARRPVETAPQRIERVERMERERPERPRPRYRGAPPPIGGTRAIGEASPTLEKAAAMERTNVTTDLRRLGIVTGITFAVLLASGFAVGTLLR